MRTPLRLILAFCALLSFQALHAETADPSDLFLKAYMTAQDADKLMQDNHLQEALTKYRFAASLLDQIRNHFPQWQPLIVDYRRKRTSESISQIQNQISLSNTSEENTTPTTAIPGEANTTPLTTNSGAAENPALVPPGQTTTTSPDITAPVATPMPGISDNNTATSSTSTDTVAVATKEIQKSIEDLQRKYQIEHAQLLVMQQQRDALALQLDNARVSKSENQAKLAQLQDQLATATANASSATANKKDRAKLQQLIKDLQAERDAADERASDLENKLTVIRKTAQTAISARDKAQDEVKKLPAQYAETKKQLNDVTKQRDDLKNQLSDSKKQFAKVAQERDTALTNLKKAQESGKQVDKLIAENTALTAKLANAEKTIKNLSQSAPEKDAEIASLKKEIGGVKQQLAAAQQEKNDSRAALVALQSQLDETTSHLEAAQSEQSANHENADTQKLTQENQLLRGIVLRELREQAKRDQTKKLVISQLAKLQNKSTDLIDEINYLGQPTTQLTDAEKKLFKLPTAEILESSTSGAALNVALSAPKSTETGATGSAANPSPTPATSGSTESSANTHPSPLATPETTTANTETETPANHEVGIESLPESLQTVAKKAQEEFKRNDYRDAEKSYQKILAVAPKNLYALSNLGVTRLRAGKFKLAEETFKKAILLSPNNSFTHCSLGIVYYGEQRYDDAIKELTRALAIDPKNATAHNYLGITASTKGWQEAAEKELETAIALDTNYADAYFNLAVVQITKHPPETELAKYNYARARSLGAAPDRELEKLLKKK